MPAMSMPRADPAAVRRFEALVPTAPDVAVRPMFGQPAAFARGNLFFGVFGDQIFVRLGAPDRTAALALDGARPFAPMAGRPMKEYVVLPGPVLARSRDAATWVARSLRYARGLPPKASVIGRRPR